MWVCVFRYLFKTLFDAFLEDPPLEAEAPQQYFWQCSVGHLEQDLISVWHCQVLFFAFEILPQLILGRTHTLLAQGLQLGTTALSFYCNAIYIWNTICAINWMLHSNLSLSEKMCIVNLNLNFKWPDTCKNSIVWPTLSFHLLSLQLVSLYVC